LNVLNKLAEEKCNSLKGDQYMERKKKTIDYLLQKGYDYEDVNKALSYLTEK
jgi:regulatory protein